MSDETQRMMTVDEAMAWGRRLGNPSDGIVVLIAEVERLRRVADGIEEARKQLLAKLRRFEEREPLVQELVAGVIDVHAGDFGTMDEDAAHCVLCRATCAFRDFVLEPSNAPVDTESEASEASPVNAGECQNCAQLERDVAVLIKRASAAELKLLQEPFARAVAKAKTLLAESEAKPVNAGESVSERYTKLRGWMQNIASTHCWNPTETAVWALRECPELPAQSTREQRLAAEGFEPVQHGQGAMMDALYPQPEAKPAEAFRALTEKWKAEPYDYDPNAEAKPVDGDEVDAALRQIDKRQASAERGSDLGSARVLAAKVRRLREEGERASARYEENLREIAEEYTAGRCAWVESTERMTAERDQLKAEVERAHRQIELLQKRDLDRPDS